MKERYTIEQDGFVGYWHTAGGHDGKALLVFPGSGADYELTCNKAREDSMKEAIAFLEGWE